MASGKSQFRVGDTVNHKKLGRGDILDIFPLGEDTCAVISFEKSGQKKIILKYAALELVARAKVEPDTKASRAEARAEPKAEARAAKDIPEEVEEAVEIEGGEEEEET
jgi:PcrA/UvrD tudor domain